MEKRYVLEVVNKINKREENKRTAASKPVSDAIAILTKELNFNKLVVYYNIDYSFKKNPIRYLYFFLKYLFSLRSTIASIPDGSVLLIQYVLPGRLKNYRAIQYISKFLHKRNNIKKIVYIHDIDSFRDKSFKKAKEISALNTSFDFFIVHNKKMKTYLAESGIEKEMFELGIFDYLSSTTVNTSNNEYSDGNKIVFTGNLGKSEFIYQLNRISNWFFYLYGPYYNEEINSSENVVYKGSLPPSDLSKGIKDYDFGLVWDGPSLDKLSGEMGNYMKINNPFKFSAYIEAGLPVITSKEAGIASFVEKENVGVLVDSLKDLENLKIDATAYASMKKNVNKWRDKIAKGAVLKKMIQEIMNK